MKKYAVQPLNSVFFHNFMFKRILVATHGTEGAKKAERLALELASQNNAELFVLYVINSNWSSITGIEWLNASHTRMEFYKHLEEDIYQKAEQTLKDINMMALENQIKINNIISVGIPEKVICNECEKNQIQLLVLGRKIKGKRADYIYTLQFKKIKDSISCPILIV